MDTYQDCLYYSRSFAGAWIEINVRRWHADGRQRRSFAGAWIEINLQAENNDLRRGRSFAGAWIEIISVPQVRRECIVAPSRERGLKSLTSVGAAYGVSRSFAGAWIEIESSGSAGQPDKGRSFAGAWIEIY